MSSAVSVNDFAESFADFQTYYCNYLTKNELTSVCKIARFRTNFDYTDEFYWKKIRYLLGMRQFSMYKRPRFTSISVNFFKYLSSVTVVLEKRNVYTNYIARFALKIKSE